MSGRLVDANHALRLILSGDIDDLVDCSMTDTELGDLLCALCGVVGALIDEYAQASGTPRAAVADDLYRGIVEGDE